MGRDLIHQWPKIGENIGRNRDLGVLEKVNMNIILLAFVVTHMYREQRLSSVTKCIHCEI